LGTFPSRQSSRSITKIPRRPIDNAIANVPMLS
jgi:hypothetical protein